MKKIFNLFILLFSLASLFVLSSCSEAESEQIEQRYFEQAHNHIINNHTTSHQLYSYSGYEYNGNYIYYITYHNEYSGEYSSYYVLFKQDGNRYCSSYSCESYSYSYSDIYFEYREYGNYLYLSSPYDSNSNNSSNDSVSWNPLRFLDRISIQNIFDAFEDLFNKIFAPILK